MAEAIRRLPDQPAPSTVKLAGYVDGFDAINMVIDGWLGPCNAESRPLELISG